MNADRLRRLEHPVCLASGAVLAALYLYWQYVYNHWIATYTWMVPFGIGYAIPLFLFSLKISRAEQALRDPGLPAARARKVTAPPAPAPVVIKPPERTPTANPAEPPQLLK